MTALTLPARLEEDTSLRSVPWRRMAWVTWRQHRVALAGVAAFLSVSRGTCGLPALSCTMPMSLRPPAARPHLPALT